MNNTNKETYPKYKIALLAIFLYLFGIFSGFYLVYKFQPSEKVVYVTKTVTSTIETTPSPVQTPASYPTSITYISPTNAPQETASYPPPSITTPAPTTLPPAPASTPVIQTPSRTYNSLPEQPPKVENGKKQEIEAYFLKMDRALSEGKTWGDPNAFAQQIIMASIKGDTSGFDSLINSFEQVKKKLGQIVPPDECKDYHQQVISAIDSSLDLLRTMKSAISTKDLEKLLPLQSKAKDLENRIRKTDALASKIKNKYQIKTP